MSSELEEDPRTRGPEDMKVPREEVMSDILKRLTGESVLPVYSSVVKFRRAKDGSYRVAQDLTVTVKKRELVNAKERMRVSPRDTSGHVLWAHSQEDKPYI